MQFQFLDIIIIVSIVQLFVFVLFLFKKKPVSLSNKILAFFLFIQIILLFNVEILRFRDLLTGILIHFIHIGAPFYFLPAPVFYLYIKSRVYKDFSITKKDLIHAIPFIVSVVIMIFTFYYNSAEAKRLIIQQNSFFTNTFSYVFNAAFAVQFITYFVIDLKILRVYRKEIREYFSSVDSINLSWISYLLYCFIIAFFANTVTFMIRFFLPDLLIYGFAVTYLLFFIFFNYIYYKGFSNPEIFAGIESKPKYVSSNLSKPQSEEYLHILETYMQKEKPFLNPDLTLKDLSEQMSIPARHISQVINEQLNQNFYDFISRHRIEEAKHLLSGSSNKTILEILYSAGFNSKSSFNSAFKKFTGQTPTDFKNSL